MSNLPEKYKKGIFYKIKEFFVDLFIKKENFYKNPASKFENKREENDCERFKKDLLLDINDKINLPNKEKQMKKSIIEIIEDNPKLLDKLSINNLRNTLKLYDEKIEEMKEKIKLLESKK